MLQNVGTKHKEINNMDDIQVAVAMGCLYRGNAAELPPPVPDDIATVVHALDTSYNTLRGMHDFVCVDYQTHILNNAVFVAFFSQGPLDRVIMGLHRQTYLLRTSQWVHDLLRTIITSIRTHLCDFQTTRIFERMAVGLPIVEAVSSPDVPLIGPCIDLLIFACNVSRNLIRDQPMFRTLATHMHKAIIREKIMNLLDVADLYSDTPMVEDLFLTVIRTVVNGRRTGQQPTAVEHMERMLRFNVDLRSGRFATHLAELWRTNWPVELGTILSHLLETDNVVLVLILERMGRLTALIHASNIHTTIEWRAARGHLRRMLPGRVCSVLGEPNSGSTRPLTNVTCPITLDTIVDPVVLTDGHTYERDAIMRHLTSRGLVSPMTRQPVTPYVVTNRAVLLPD